jgi:hypothetical protein
MLNPAVKAALDDVPAGESVRLRLKDGREFVGVLQEAGDESASFADRDDIDLDDVEAVLVDASSAGPE